MHNWLVVEARDQESSKDAVYKGVSKVSKDGSWKTLTPSQYSLGPTLRASQHDLPTQVGFTNWVHLLILRLTSLGAFLMGRGDGKFRSGGGRRDYISPEWNASRGALRTRHGDPQTRFNASQLQERPVSVHSNRVLEVLNGVCVIIPASTRHPIEAAPCVATNRLMVTG